MSDLLTNNITQKKMLLYDPSFNNVVLLYGKSQNTMMFFEDSIKNKYSITQDNIYTIENDVSDSITIDQVRALKSYLSKKTPSDKKFSRLIKIMNFENATLEAQNALLKTIEEPPTDTVIVLTANNLTKIRSTIKSRTVLIPILPVSFEAFNKYAKENKLSTEEGVIRLVYLLSEGNPDVAIELINNSELLFEIKAQITGYISSSKEKQFGQIDLIIKDKDSLERFLLHLRAFALASMVLSKNQSSINKWRKNLIKTTELILDIKMGVNSKLIADKLLTV